MAPSWHEQSDQAVEQGLKLKLEELESADLFARLGVGPSAETTAIRQAFLSATKIFHPSRFARRPEPTRRLANEIFLLIKAAYVELSSGTGRVQSAGTGSIRALAGDPDKGRADGSARRAPTNGGISTGKATGRASTARIGGRAPTGKITGRAPVLNLSATPREAGRAPTSKPVAERTEHKRAIPSGREREEQFAAAVAMVSHGAYAEACVALQGLAEANPDLSKFRVYLHYARGRQHADAGEHQRARIEYQAALALHPQFFLATKALALLPPEQGATPAAQADRSPHRGEPEPSEPSGKRGLFSRLFRK